MKIYIGADHAGYELKEQLKKWLGEKGYQVEDKGAYKYEPEDDYPDFIFPVARAVAGEPESFGIVIGGSGDGEAMAANRVRGARAAVYYGGDFEIIELSRKHNNANILSLGARFIDENMAKKAVELWLKMPYEGGRHDTRIAKMDSNG